MIEITLTDDSGSLTLPALNVPLTENVIEGATDVVSLNNNISTSFFENKRSWAHTWAYMSEDDFNALKGYYDRQFSDFKYPKITIEHLSVEEVSVRMYLEPRNIIDHCGTVENVEVVFRETDPLPEEGS